MELLYVPLIGSDIQFRFDLGETSSVFTVQASDANFSLSEPDLAAGQRWLSFWLEGLRSQTGSQMLMNWGGPGRLHDVWAVPLLERQVRLVICAKDGLVDPDCLLRWSRTVDRDELAGAVASAWRYGLEDAGLAG